MLNRAKQFLVALTARICQNDIIFINKYLNEFEVQLFLKLSIYEQKHSINVARNIIKIYNLRKLNNEINIKRLIKVGLLHDIGKINIKLNLIDRSFLVIFDRISGSRMKTMYKKNKKVDVYYNHGQIGYNLLKKHNYDEQFLYLIKNHHKYKLNNLSKKSLSNIEKELCILIECDEKN